MIKSCWASVLLLAAASGVAAQSSPSGFVERAELVLPPSAASPELVRALQRAVHPLPSTLVTVAEPPCPQRASAATTLRIALQEREGGTYRLCLVWGDQRALRELGPFATLDAAAREQISTIVEATVEALRPVDPEAALQEEQVTRKVLLSVGYAPSLLASRHYAHGIAAELGLELSSILFASLHLAHTFPTTIERAGASATADALAARAALGGAFPLSPSFALLGLLGVTVERLSVRAGGSSSEQLRSPSTRTPVDPWLTAQLGSRLALGPNFWLSGLVGADLGFARRQFGFARGDEFVRVFESGPWRAHFELQAGCFL